MPCIHFSKHVHFKVVDLSQIHMRVIVVAPRGLCRSFVGVSPNPSGWGGKKIIMFSIMKLKITKHAALQPEAKRWREKRKSWHHVASSKQPCQYNPLCQSMDRWMDVDVVQVDYLFVNTQGKWIISSLRETDSKSKTYISRDHCQPKGVVSSGRIVESDVESITCNSDRLEIQRKGNRRRKRWKYKKH